MSSSVWSAIRSTCPRGRSPRRRGVILPRSMIYFSNRSVLRPARIFRNSLRRWLRGSQGPLTRGPSNFQWLRRLMTIALLSTVRIARDRQYLRKRNAAERIDIDNHLIVELKSKFDNLKN
jgi:hypothetical protein